MAFLREDTTVTVVIGPAVDSNGAVVTGLECSGTTIVDLYKGATGSDLPTIASTSSLISVAGGYYSLVLSSGSVDTTGLFRVAVGFAGALPMWEPYDIIAAKVYDSLIGSDNLEVDTIQVMGAAVTTGAAQIGVNVFSMKGGLLTAGTIAAGLISSGTFDTGALTLTAIGAAALGSGKFGTGVISSGTLGANALTAGTIAAGAISSGTIGDLVLTAGNFDAGFAQASLMSVISVSVLSTGAYFTTMTEDDAGTPRWTQNSLELAPAGSGGTVTVTISTGSFEAGAITLSAFATGALGSGKFGTGALSAATFGAAFLSTGSLGAFAMTSGNFAAGAITLTAIGAGALGSGKFGTGVISSGTLGANALTAGTIAAGVISSGTLGAFSLSAANFAAAIISSGTLGAFVLSEANVIAELAKASATSGIITTLGAAGAGLTAVPWNTAWAAQVESEATDALNAYDPPTKAELDTGTASVQAAITAASTSVQTAVSAASTSVQTAISGLNDITVADILAGNIETETLQQVLRLMRAVLVGKSAGGGTATLEFQDRADSKARVTATVDADGNRTAVTVDAT